MAAANFICSPEKGIIDPVQLHFQAINALARCLFELRCAETSYDRASGHASYALDLVRTLSQLNPGAQA
ncbi:hypothetical protein PSQ20_21735 [Curvibacter sp. RS43]|uniref:hypothetical protein n=1 Tax=Curvibacter microcysteis TaxID=3026419 RepID=UPI00236275AA|nr:hypothetical protein [Curvibacter sp. RS43]MDD0812972.1 hypothetical protein [Curvibacter sp. RS43]